MTHKVHPYGHRLGILRGWQSRWFNFGRHYREFLRVDTKLREWLDNRLRPFYLKSIEMERGRNSLRVIIKTARPGMLIGRRGEGSVRLRGDVVKFLSKIGATVPQDLKIDIEEVKEPESHARIVAMMIIDGLEKRMHFRRVMRQTLQKVTANRNVLGVRFTLSGRLGGADIARSETLKHGRLPLQTLRADVDFVEERAQLPYGVIGVKVWIYRGEILDGAKAKEQ